MNDVAIAPDGTVFFTDPRFLGDEPRSQPVYGVYAVDKDLNVTLTLGNVQKPNGVAVSPDGKTLYVAEHYINNDNLFTYDGKEALIHGPMRVLAYDLDGVKVTSKPRVVVNYDGPDGMVTDTNGNLYVASRAEDHVGIEIFNPQGELIDFVPTPVKPTNVALTNGEFKHKLYITAGASLFVIDTLSEGW
ncbi:SMP-30/gluconolactonase/LRE family protein [Vibrio sp. JC009]|uniref:SMP-30/gluconolactonase/LRE family protein n=1 Tax=Vibrio sp. JC009 TaxID=2912314 RepID=UPI0023B10DDF|nr:SMP-30/gluconolactonase/LRE family protein [Vibrio sp. JC009]WED24997.1 SMP-30/gluconolactonase/LRE family protein [Vibrio sp. JC009]